MEQHEIRIDGILLDEGLSLTLTELTRLCGSSGRTLRLMVTEGLLQPQGAAPAEWRFSGLDLRRAQRALRLQRDLALNLSGTALALDLLEELDDLRERIRVLEYRIGTQWDREPG